MGINQSNRHKRRKTGGRRVPFRKKRKFEMGRQPANTKLGPRKVAKIRCRGGNYKLRALRLDTGIYAWGSEGIARRTRILGEVYNATSNEYVRTNTLVKNSIIQIDATPYRQWYQHYYGIKLGKKRVKTATKETPAEGKAAADAAGEKKKAKTVGKKIKSRKTVKVVKSHLKDLKPVDAALAEQFNTGRLYACIASKPSVVGRADGYILEGQELEFYLKRIKKKKQ